MKAKYNTPNKWRFLSLLPLVCLALLTLGTSCSDDEKEGGTFAKIGWNTTNPAGESIVIMLDENFVMTSPWGGLSKQDLFMYSDVRNWTIKADHDWITIWPAEGDKDGRFSFDVKKNTTREARTSNVRITSGGKDYFTIPVAQAAGTDDLSLSFTTKTAPLDGAVYKVFITSNIGWGVSFFGDVPDWIQIGEQGEDYATIHVAKHELDENGKAPARSAVLLFSGADNPAVSAKLTIKKNEVK